MLKASFHLSFLIQRSSGDVTAQEILPQVESDGPASLLLLLSKSFRRSLYSRSLNSCQGTSSLTRPNLVSGMATPQKRPLSLALVKAVQNPEVMFDEQPTSDN